MYSHLIVGFGPEDPVGLLDSCYRAEKWILATHIAKALLIPRPWIDHPYGEEEIDRRIEADQDLEFLALQAR